ncbi:cytochrome P450 [Diplocarpon rosae]|nr:cytochrome P450 [Diplocarpon rosae]
MSNGFYDTTDSSPLIPQTLLSKLWESIPIPPTILATLLLGPLVIFLTAQLLLVGLSENSGDGKECDLWMVPFQSIPWQVLESVSIHQFCSVLMNMLTLKFFGTPAKAETDYQTALDILVINEDQELNACTKFLLDEPYMTKILKALVKNLEQNIPQMISFIETPIDLQPWEHYAEARFISSSETEINLTSLVQDMMGHAAVPSIFGNSLIEKNPSILHDVRNMDAGRSYLLRKLPPWVPWPTAARAHLARFKVWQSLDDHQKAIDVTAAEEDVEPSREDLGDVSLFLMKRNENITSKLERGQISVQATPSSAFRNILWSLAANSTLVPYWQLHHILAIPGLSDRVRTEIAPYASVTKPFSIGKISEAPRLVLDYIGLSQKCPLLRSTYLETLRLVDEQWNSRRIFVPGVGAVDDLTYPGKFDPDRYIPVDQEGTVVPPDYGDSSLQKSNMFMQTECLSLVAGILIFWDISLGHKDADSEVPEKRNFGGVAVPASETRVRIQRRKFEWME